MFCSACGTQANDLVSFCSNCGAEINESRARKSANDATGDFRKAFAVTLWLAAATAFFWFLQRYEISYDDSVFGAISGLLSIAARVTAVVAFARRSINWLVVSALASITSLILSVLSSLLFGTYYYPGPALVATWFASIGTVVALYIQGSRRGVEFRALRKADW